MNVRRFIAGLTLGGLLTSGLLLGGCARQSHAQPPASDRPPASHAVATSTAPDDVDGLLDEVDKQLNADDQPLEDQD
jgi:hypothetical protein